MNANTQRVQFIGGAGRIEGLIDLPASAPLGTALIAHPNPLFGGSMDNKVVQTIARAALAAGYRAVRFNFRGVGASEGVHDDGAGEADDYCAVLEQLGHAPRQALFLAGFSFGTFVLCRALARIHPAQPVHKLALVGTATSRWAVPPLPAELHPSSLVLHGETDDTVPLASVLDWARPQSLPVTVLPGVGHFFHGQLPLLKDVVLRHLRTPT